MSSDKGLTVTGAPRKRRLKGFDPLINARAPTSLIEMVKALSVWLETDARLSPFEAQKNGDDPHGAIMKPRDDRMILKG
jgi:hypothetical protein